uniref:CSON000080 protein n=1 Tax=Culicoides sonorensis TaxID=179676 RepID=A0A336LPR8_CULSO
MCAVVQSVRWTSTSLMFVKVFFYSHLFAGTFPHKCHLIVEFKFKILIDENMLSLRDLSIHGNTYIFRNDLHFIERCFWMIIVILSLISSFLISMNEWDKFRNNPTALFIETDFRQIFFDRPGLTICPIDTDETRIIEILKTNYSLSDPEIIANTNYTNLIDYGNFTNDTMISEQDFGKIATEIKIQSANSKQNMNLILSELGVCFTSSRIHLVMNPYKSIQRNSSKDEVMCRAGAVCKLSYEPNSGSKNIQYYYIHSKDDIPSLDTRIKGQVIPGNLSNIYIGVNELRADNSVRSLRLNSRKCRFSDEPETGSYYKRYTVNLCAVNCRIRAALKYCDCVPFFYIAKGTSICNATGMICLNKNSNWSSAKCDCLDTCTSITYREQAVGASQMMFFTFDTQLNIILTCPKTRIIRKVIYSFLDFLESRFFVWNGHSWDEMKPFNN